MFAEKQKLVADLEVYGAGHGGGAAQAPAVPAEAPAGQALSLISNLTSYQNILCSLLLMDSDVQKLLQKHLPQKLPLQRRKLLPPKKLRLLAGDSP